MKMCKDVGIPFEGSKFVMLMMNPKEGANSVLIC